MIEFLSLFEKNQGVAGWVQAFASVVAIYWAGRLSRDQLDRQSTEIRVSEGKSNAQRIATVVAIGEIALEEYRNAIRGFSGGHEKAWNYAHSVYNRGTFKYLLHALKKFPLHDLPDAESAQAVVRLRDTGMQGFGFIKTCIAEFERTPMLADTALEELKTAHRHMSALIAALVKRKEIYLETK